MDELVRIFMVVWFERASRPLVGFGVLIDNTIKGLTCLHEIVSRNLIKKLVLNKIAHMLQASVFIPLALYICDKQNKKRKDRARCSW